MEIKEFKNIDALSEKAAEFFIAIAKKEINYKGFFTVALAGGNSPKKIYNLLAKKFAKKIDWNKVFIFWGDDRYIPHTDRESNYKMVYDNLISKINIPQQNIFRIPVEIYPPENSALLYEKIMKKFFFTVRQVDSDKQLPIFDLIMLGIGVDGHTASLFPGHRAVNEQKRWVVHVKAHARVTLRDRITITIPVINNAKNVMFVISGAGKGKIIKNILENKDKGKIYPASRINLKEGQTVWFIDKKIY